MTTTGVAVVTGGGSGLGREITRALLGPAGGWPPRAAGRTHSARLFRFRGSPPGSTLGCPW